MRGPRSVSENKLPILPVSSSKLLDRGQTRSMFEQNQLTHSQSRSTELRVVNPSFLDAVGKAGSFEGTPPRPLFLRASTGIRGSLQVGSCRAPSLRLKAGELAKRPPHRENSCDLTSCDQTSMPMEKGAVTVGL